MIATIDVEMKQEEIVKNPYNTLLSILAVHYVNTEIGVLNQVEELFKDTVNNLHQREISQWSKGYPNNKLMENIIKGESFIKTNSKGEILFHFAVSNNLPQYYPELGLTSKYIVIKSVSRNFKLEESKGEGKMFFQKIIQNSLRAGVETIILDCEKENSGLNKYYLSLGFQQINKAVSSDGRDMNILKLDLSLPELSNYHNMHPILVSHSSS